MRKLLLTLLIGVLFIGIANAQVGDFFKPVPKPQTRLSLVIVDSANLTLNTFRPIANVASYGVGNAGGALLTGAGVSYQHLKWDQNSQKWNAVWSVSSLIWYKAPLDPSDTNPNAFAYGVVGGILNNLILVGVAYDGKNPFATIGIGISLNN